MMILHEWRYVTHHFMLISGEFMGFFMLDFHQRTPLGYSKQGQLDPSPGVPPSPPMIQITSHGQVPWDSGTDITVPLGGSSNWLLLVAAADSPWASTWPYLANKNGDWFQQQSGDLVCSRKVVIQQSGDTTVTTATTNCQIGWSNPFMQMVSGCQKWQWPPTIRNWFPRWDDHFLHFTTFGTRGGDL